LVYGAASGAATALELDDGDENAHLIFDAEFHRSQTKSIAADTSPVGWELASDSTAMATVLETIGA
jgi:hypothetical protein